ncbi:AraC family transcriptional regulator [Undibacterium sp. TS12]|uniref:helix-turn-helix transcriptional regulator n=1 Tax=Undibacterium sp. TS12 TaxID=2908202 RepID=UPI001F4CDBC4|nr:AraC family transcriptional regulator [Undibacterium sp. TS12]MCH8617770.1 helix-turn-helix transcriptional regulator [Undibacterium sp. TS12]
MAKPAPDDTDELECETADLVLLPIAGVLAKHDGPKQHVIANANHAIFLGEGKPYRITFPGDIGDEALVLDFSKEALTQMLIDAAGVQQLYAPALRPHSLLPPASVLSRELLWRHLHEPVIDTLAVQEISVTVLTASVQAACFERRQLDRVRHTETQRRRRQQVEAVKELISLYPQQEWALDELARQVHTSPFHLARVFREEVGLPVHRYLIRTRLAKALRAMQATRHDLTQIAHACGFVSHSHFTSSFRSVFGMTPSQSRLRSMI